MTETTLPDGACAPDYLTQHNQPIDDRPRWLVLLVNFIGYLFPNRRKLSEYEAEIERLEGLNAALVDPRILSVNGSRGLEMLMRTPIAHMWAAYGLQTLKLQNASNYVALRFWTHDRSDEIEVLIRRVSGISPANRAAQLYNDLHAMAVEWRKKDRVDQACDAILRDLNRRKGGDDAVSTEA